MSILNVGGVSGKLSILCIGFPYTARHCDETPVYIFQFFVLDSWATVTRSDGVKFKVVFQFFVLDSDYPFSYLTPVGREAFNSLYWILCVILDVGFLILDSCFN